MRRIDSAKWAVLAAMTLWVLPAEAETPPPRLLLLLSTSAPPGIKLAAINRALELYAQDFLPTVETETLDVSEAAALAKGRARGHSLVAYVSWAKAADGPGWVLTVAVVDPLLGRAVDSFTLAHPAKPDAAFYRVMGLKERSLLSAALTSRAPAPSTPAAAPVATPVTPAAVVADTEPSTHSGPAIEVSFLYAVPLNGQRTAPGLSATALWVFGRWGVGLAGSTDFGRPFTALDGTGSSSIKCVSATGRFRFLSVGEAPGGRPRFETWARAEAGVASVSSSAMLNATGEKRTVGDAVPVGLVGVATHLRIFSVLVATLGIQVQLLPTSVTHTLNNERIFDSGRAQLQLELGLSAAP